MTKYIMIKVMLVPKLKYNLISALKAFENEFKIAGRKDNMSLVKNNIKIKFDC